MQNRHILYYTILGIITILSILIVQVFWIYEASKLSQSQFEQTVNLALRDIAEKITANKKSTLQYKNPVKKINQTFYLVQVNSDIDPKSLDYYMSSVFDYFNIDEDVEYGIYSCYSDQLVYCNYIQKNKPLQSSIDPPLPKEKGLDYYFTVSFPHYRVISLHNIPMWAVTSFILFLALAFFIYSLFIVYKQRDITQIQKDFINNMTHEFKTPISTISVIQQAINDVSIVNSPEKLKKYSNIIGVEAARLNDLVEKVLNITKIEKGEFSLTKEEISINELVAHIANQCHERYQIEYDAQIKYQVEATLDLAKVDLIHFTNILFNLIDNAVKYSGKKPIVMLNTVNRGKKIEVSVSDNGQGLDEKEIKRIFQKFYRIPTGNVHNIKGFGLGLYYVKKIIDAHKFEINVHSKVGEGTTFIISLPIIQK